MNKTAKIVSAGAAFVLAAGLGVLAYVQREKETDIPTALEYSTEPVTEIVPEPITYPVYESYVPSPEGITEMAKIMLQKNKDYVGWIRIDHTFVDYPVFKDPGELYGDIPYYGNESFEANEFYLHHTIDRVYDFAGSVFMDYRDEFGGVEEAQSENIVLYGHSMLNGTMFGSLRQYWQDYGFFEKSPFIEFSSNYRNYDYVICGCLITSGYKESDFTYWDMEELDSREDFDFYIGKMREKQLFDTGVDVKYGDQLLTLSTCYSDADNSRFIVIARKLRDGEKAGDLKTIERTEEYKKAHKKDKKDNKQK